jgi:hypothetical protein
MRREIAGRSHIHQPTKEPQVQISKLPATLATAALLAFGAGGVAVAQSDSQSAAKGPKRGPTAAQTSTLAKKLGVTAAQLKAAMAATRPDRAGRPDRGDFAADIASALGVEKAAVQEILDANRPARPAQRPSRGTAPDHSALIEALASGLNLDKATVTAAFEKLDAAREADHEARHAAMAAALAQELGLDAGKVAKALEATRPARP